MPNKTEDWLNSALDAVPSQPAPFGFRRDLRDRLVREGLCTESIEAPAGRFHRFVSPLLSAAAALLLIAVGYQLGAGEGSHVATVIDSGGSIAEADLIDLYEMREVIDAWDLAEDAALERAFAALDETWVEELLATEEY
ncbi:MAG: hypothetical protein MK209_01535 [Planctomycetes bacterium]|nr:hypothetical protein [Planctomycetota bacterium]